MSKIGEQLRRLHSSAAPMGFGFTAVSAPRRQMLVLVRVDSPLDEAAWMEVVSRADAVVVEADVRDTAVAAVSGKNGQGAVICGLDVEAWRELPQDALENVDFVVCGCDGPLSVFGKERGLILAIGPQSDPSELRAIGELGVDAVILDARTLDLGTVACAIECRRVRSSSGRPVILHVAQPLDVVTLEVLWRAGVDGLLLDAGTGSEVLAAVRSAVGRAMFAARPGGGGATAAIGAYFHGAVNEQSPDADEEDGDEEGEDDEDE